MSKLQAPLFQFMRGTFPSVVFSEPREPIDDDGWEIRWDSTDQIEQQRVHFALECFVAGYRAAKRAGGQQ